MIIQIFITLCFIIYYYMGIVYFAISLAEYNIYNDPKYKFPYNNFFIYLLTLIILATTSYILWT